MGTAPEYGYHNLTTVGAVRIVARTWGVWAVRLTLLTAMHLTDQISGSKRWSVR